MVFEIYEMSCSKDFQKILEPSPIYTLYLIETKNDL
jgi:hypothetical protein